MRRKRSSRATASRWRRTGQGCRKDCSRIIVLSHDQTSRILGAGLVDHCNFTGSVSGGRSIERAAAGSFTSLGLELGGKDPAYVRADANIDHAIENLVDGAFFNSGQCCCGIERIYVHETHYERFVSGAVELVNKYVLGNPLDEKTTLGPMAHKRFADLVRTAKRRGRRERRESAYRCCAVRR